MAPLKALGCRRRLGHFRDRVLPGRLEVPDDVLSDQRGSPDWPSIVADAPASLGDLRAVARYAFIPERFQTLTMPVLLQIGSESPADFYVTDALATCFPTSRSAASKARRTRQ